jgi:hypothetical protein
MEIINKCWITVCTVVNDLWHSYSLIFSYGHCISLKPMRTIAKGLDKKAKGEYGSTAGTLRGRLYCKFSVPFVGIAGEMRG